MANDNKNGSGGFDSDWSIDWSQSDEYDLDEFEDIDSLESQFWAPYEAQQRQKGRGSTGAEIRDGHQPTERDKKRAAAEVTRQKKRRGKNRRRIPAPLAVLIYIVFVVGGSLVLATFGWIAANDVLALNKEPLAATIELTSESTVDEITDKLESNGLIEYPWLFKLYCKVTSAEEKFSFGSFEVNTEMDYHALVSALSSSSTTKQTIQVMIPEGYTVDQIFQLLVDSGVCETVTDLQEMAANHDYAFDFLQDIPLGDYRRLEGYLFPDTYEFYLGQDPLYVINKMLVNFDDKVTQEMRDTAANMGYSLHQIIIISSLIEKESNGIDQRNIASVIYNRLNSDVTQGLLQFDSTIQYILELQGNERKDQLLETDLAIDSPYNTYLYAGLPAGPICNAGLDCIQAALNPNSTDYIYFLQDNSGNSYFYNNYDEFIAGKNLYLAQGYVPEEEDNTNYEDFNDAAG